MLNNFKTIYDLLHNLDENQVLQEVKEIDPDNYEDYKDLLNYLKTLKLTPKNMTAIVSLIKEEDEKDNWYNVDGLSHDDNIRYGIEFTPWSEWLSMKFKIENCDLSYPQILAYFLNEMTWMGFDEEKIQGQFEEIYRKTLFL